ncbi:hypothetical protein EDC40_104270 [Aminobacter aminovorans]|uniref:Uncharacterized protein n=1 Tax=Aminobacter aminovorans TaxID=83263 RepID=A0A380WGJ6_AMIAI|nr:hypothetical protein [Aminobacter aminovorans]TCS26802.1 hypothetical protein EDC40_104270 [Aminobacter aminovorans]SUU88139.1 Uncharacterised protein [Aminobacter aminovorans]
MYELMQNLLVAAWYGQPSEHATDAVPDEPAVGSVGDRLHRDLDACFQAIHEQISERKQ